MEPVNPPRMERQLELNLFSHETSFHAINYCFSFAIQQQQSKFFGEAEPQGRKRATTNYLWYQQNLIGSPIRVLLRPNAA